MLKTLLRTCHSDYIVHALIGIVNFVCNSQVIAALQYLNYG